FLKVVKDLGLLHKIGMITCDNASNNDTKMEHIELLLKQRGIPFDRHGNRIRDDPEYAQALSQDAVAAARSLVVACRASGQRREDFQKTIINGNNSRDWEPPLPANELLRDVDTRWSSTFLMIDRLLEMYPAVNCFLHHPKQEEIKYHIISKPEQRVLLDIREYLQVPHSVQEVVCSDRTPTVPIVIPLYEMLLAALRRLLDSLPKIAHAISAAIFKIEEYVKKGRRSRIYALAMVINPTTKLKWIEEHWKPDEARDAREWVLQEMFKYRKALRPVLDAEQTKQRRAEQSQTRSSSDEASRALSRGFSFVKSLAKGVQGASTPSASSAPSPASTSGEDNTPTAESSDDTRELEKRMDARDRLAVEQELQKYIEADLLEYDNPADFDLIGYWDAHEKVFPTLFCVALDILPAQALSVPSERAFSSGSDTDTKRRSRLSAVLFEVLQILKAMIREDRLDFSSGWVSKVDELQSSPPDAAAAQIDELEKLNEFMDKGLMDDLINVLNNEDNGFNIQL
ncbi:hypothetical protein GLOTRDRAFT_30409, partial [Gloeophyllum trabeum ATCC 11539]